MNKTIPMPILSFSLVPQIRERFPKTTIIQLINRQPSLATMIIATAASAYPKDKSKPKATHKAFRQNIDKTVLGEYTDTDATPSHTDRQEQIEAWRAAVVAELEQAERDRVKREQEELFYFVASLKSIPKKRDVLPSREEQIEAWRAAVVAELEQAERDRIKREQEELFYFVASLKSIPEKEAVLEWINNETNAFIADRFVKKYNGADTNAAMRAYEKQKRNSTKLAYWQHELGITK